MTKEQIMDSISNMDPAQLDAILNSPLLQADNLQKLAAQISEKIPPEALAKLAISESDIPDLISNVLTSFTQRNTK